MITLTNFYDTRNIDGIQAIIRQMESDGWSVRQIVPFAYRIIVVYEKER